MEAFSIIFRQSENEEAFCHIVSSAASIVAGKRASRHKLARLAGYVGGRLEVGGCWRL